LGYREQCLEAIREKGLNRENERKIESRKGGGGKDLLNSEAAKHPASNTTPEQDRKKHRNSHNKIGARKGKNIGTPK